MGALIQGQQLQGGPHGVQGQVTHHGVGGALGPVAVDVVEQLAMQQVLIGEVLRPCGLAASVGGVQNPEVQAVGAVVDADDWQNYGPCAEAFKFSLLL